MIIHVLPPTLTRIVLEPSLILRPQVKRFSSRHVGSYSSVVIIPTPSPQPCHQHSHASRPNWTPMSTVLVTFQPTEASQVQFGVHSNLLSSSLGETFLCFSYCLRMRPTLALLSSPVIKNMKQEGLGSYWFPAAISIMLINLMQISGS